MFTSTDACTCDTYSQIHMCIITEYQKNILGMTKFISVQEYIVTNYNPDVFAEE